MVSGCFEAHKSKLRFFYLSMKAPECIRNCVDKNN